MFEGKLLRKEVLVVIFDIPLGLALFFLVLLFKLLHQLTLTKTLELDESLVDAVDCILVGVHIIITYQQGPGKGLDKKGAQ